MKVRPLDTQQANSHGIFHARKKCEAISENDGGIPGSGDSVDSAIHRFLGSQQSPFSTKKLGFKEQQTLPSPHTFSSSAHKIHPQYA